MLDVLLPVEEEVELVLDALVLDALVLDVLEELVLDVLVLDELVLVPPPLLLEVLGAPPPAPPPPVLPLPPHAGATAARVSVAPSRIRLVCCKGTSTPGA